MGVSEPQRLALHAAARRALGEEEGDTLMALSPPANTDMATMQALDRTEAKLGARIDQVEAKLGARIDQVEAKLGARIDAVEAKLGARIDQVDAKLGARIDQLDMKIDTVAALLVGQIERSELRTRLWGLAALITTQLAVVTYLTNALG